MTSLLDSDREQPLTDAEFDALPRNSDGDIIDLEEAACFITDAQRERLTGDDQTRMDNHDEEIRCLMAEFLEHG